MHCRDWARQPSFITIKPRPEGETERTTHPLFPQTDREEGGIYPGIWFLGSTTTQCSFSLCLWLSFSHTHTHPASGWTLIWLWLETEAQRRKGRGLIFTARELGEVQYKDRQGQGPDLNGTRWEGGCIWAWNMKHKSSTDKKAREEWE